MQYPHAKGHSVALNERMMVSLISGVAAMLHKYATCSTQLQVTWVINHVIILARIHKDGQRVKLKRAIVLTTRKITDMRN